jgi:hypothetical protein
VSQSIISLSVEQRDNPYHGIIHNWDPINNKSPDEEYHYVDICTPSRVYNNENETAKSGFCNNINTTLPYLYVGIQPLYPGNVIGELKLFNIENVTEGSKYVIEKYRNEFRIHNCVASNLNVTLR